MVWLGLWPGFVERHGPLPRLVSAPAGAGARGAAVCARKAFAGTVFCMEGIDYRVGDVCDIEAGTGPWVLAHVCNDAGGWGKGFVLALSRHWPEPEAAYRQWSRGRSSAGTKFELGRIQPVRVDEGHWVVNMIAQHGYASRTNPVALRYDALADCLGKVASWAGAHDAGVRMPRIGCGLAGGSWDEIEPLIERMLVANGIGVRVYDLPGQERP